MYLTTLTSKRIDTLTTSSLVSKAKLHFCNVAVMLIFNNYIEMEKEDQLFNSALKSRNEALERIKQSQQNLIIVASLLDRIPNLAGLARTCEVICTSFVVPFFLCFSTTNTQCSDDHLQLFTDGTQVLKTCKSWECQMTILP